MELSEHNFSFPMSGELNMYYCGRRQKTRNHEYGPAIRAHFLIVFVEDGRGTLFGTKRDLRLNTGDMLVMFPGERIHYKADDESDWSILWLGLYGTLVWDFLRRLGVTPENPVFHVENFEEIRSILEDIYVSSSRNSLSDKTHCISLIYGFFTALFRTAGAPNETDPVREAMNLIQYHFDKKITVSGIAETLYLNPSYLARIFRRETGMSPKEFITAERIRKASYMLRETDAPIREIAISVGIPDQLYFSRLFREKTGLSPTKFREDAEKKAP